MLAERACRFEEQYLDNKPNRTKLRFPRQRYNPEISTESVSASYGGLARRRYTR